MSRPTNIQIEKLVEFLEGTPGIARGNIRTAQARHQTKIKWEEIAITLNSLDGATRTLNHGPNFGQIKYALKKLVAHRNGGGGPDDSGHISELDVRLIAVMSDTRFAEGDHSSKHPCRAGRYNIEEKRVEAELANAAGWRGVIEAINNLANSIVTAGNKIAEALQNHS